MMIKDDKQNTTKNSKLKNVISYLKLTPAKFVLVILFVIAVFVCISQVGETIEAPYPLSIKPEGNFSSDYKDYVSTGIIVEGEKASVMLDDGFTRFVILDKDDHVVSIKYSEMLEESAAYFQSATIANDAIYILSRENFNNNDNVKKQDLIKYDLSGNYLYTIWTEEYNPETEQFRIPRMISIEQDNEGNLFGLLLSPDDKQISIVQFENGTYEVVNTYQCDFPRETIIDATYNSESETLSVYTDAGSLYIDNGDSYREFTLVKTEGELLNYAVANDDNSISPINEKIKYRYAPEILHFSPILIFKTLLFWICLAFVILVILIFLIHKFIKLIIDKKIDIIIRVAICIAAISGILGISVYYSVQIFNNDLQTKTNLLQYAALNLSTTPNEYAKDVIKRANSCYDFKKEEYFEFKEYLEAQRNNALKSKFSLDYTIYKINKPNLVNSVTLCSTDLEQQFGLEDGYIHYEKIKGDLENEGCAVYLYTNIRGSYMSAYAIIYDDNESIGIAEVSCNYWLYIYSLVGNTLTIFITLSVILIVIATILFELAAAFRAKKLKQKYLNLKIKHPEIAYNRIFAFLCNFLSSFNSVLLVLIAKDIIDAAHLDNEAALIALPTFFLSFGIFWGQPLFEILSRKLNVKTILVSCCALMFATYLMCFYAVTVSNFWFFNLATLLSALGTGLATSVRAYMPVLAPNEEIRYELNNGSTKTWISSGIVSVAIAGLMSDLFGSASIYLLALVPVLLIFFITIFLMPSKTKYRLEKQGKKASRMISKSLKFFLQPSFLIYALGLIGACVLCHGYRNFMFPLFTDDAGISKIMISNIVVIANFIAFALNSQLNNLVKRMDFWELGIVATIVAGILYVSFAINTAVAWACVVVVLVTMIIRIMSTVNGMLWPRLCDQCNYPMSTANTFILCYTNIISAVQGFVLSSLLLLGMINACICIGVFMLVAAVLFAIITYNTALRKNKL